MAVHGGAEYNELLLTFTAPYDADAAMSALGAHAVPGVERSDRLARTHSRAVRAPSGPTVVTVRFRESHVAVSARPRIADPAWLAARVRCWLDLDGEPVKVARALSDDSTIGPLITARPGLRVLGYLDVLEGAIMTVIGQQVSLAATRTFGARLVKAFGTRVDDRFSVYPTVEELASLRPADVQGAIGLTTARARTVVGLAAALADGLELEPQGDLSATRSALLSLPGIGPWTVDYLSVRALGDRDAFVPGDLVLRRALGVETTREADALAEAWRPYRAYALYHLWTKAAYS